MERNKLSQRLSPHQNWHLPRRALSPSASDFLPVTEKRSTRNLVGCVAEASTKIFVIGTFVALLMSSVVKAAPSTLDSANLASVSKGRCATRIAIALTGKGPSQELMGASDPQAMVDSILKQPDFIEHFSRYFNARANGNPGANSAEDATYHLSKYILTKGNEPWKNMFVGAYDLVATGMGAAQTVTVQPSPNGLGFFRNRVWLDRYAGNEAEGLKLATIYRIMNNVVGLELVATTNAPGADVSATGRRAAGCKSCHYEGWYALDINTAVLSKVQRQGQTITYIPPDGQPKQVLGGVMARDDKEFVTALVESESFAFNACRVAFGFTYGRNENQCEA